MLMNRAWLVLWTLAVTGASETNQQMSEVASQARDNLNDGEERTFPSNLTCQFASLRCSYRTGCGHMLKAYLIECADLISNRTLSCSEGCKNTLVGLASTKEGKDLMLCQCHDDECTRTKNRVSSGCHAAAAAAVAVLDDIDQHVGGGVSPGRPLTCSEARWVCTADAECGKALEYYHLYCRAMFRGLRCSDRCANSLSILRRQPKAAHLSECTCTDDEMFDNDFTCTDVKANTNKLCLKEAEQTLADEEKIPGEDEEILSENTLEEDEETSGEDVVFSSSSSSSSSNVCYLLNWSTSLLVLLSLGLDK